MLRVPTAVLACALCGCQSTVQHGLDEREANEIHAVLSAKGIEASKVSEGGRKLSWAISVPSHHASEAVQLLADLGLPRRRPEGLHEVYGKGGLVPSASEERALYMRALAGELAQTLESFEGVLSARVHLVPPPSPRPGQPALTAKAAVFLRVQPEAKARIWATRGEIRALVAGSLEGLSPESVTLVLGEVSPHPPVVTPRTSSIGTAVPALLISGAGALCFGVLRRRRRSTARERDDAAAADKSALGEG